MLKIAIPSETDAGFDSQRSGHFGHAPFFTIVTYNDDLSIADVEVVKNVEHDAYGCGGVIDYVLGLGLDGILATGMGVPPYTRFTENGMKVYSDRTEPNVGKVAEMFAAGLVAPMDPSTACRH